jgi:hypothetical protein
MKIEPDAVLVCTACGVEGPHELLYLSDRVQASECANCGTTRMFTNHLYAEYAKDVAHRGFRLPFGLAGRALRNPREVICWPVKGVKKPFGLLREFGQVATRDVVYRHVSARMRRTDRSGEGGRVTS